LSLYLSFMLTVLHNDLLWAKIKWTLRSFKVDFKAKLQSTWIKYAYREIQLTVIRCMRLFPAKCATNILMAAF